MATGQLSVPSVIPIGHEPREVKVSVIVPVWNVEPYLAECLDSVLGQSIGLDRLEIIAVDDGSTDGSGALLDAYARRYPQLVAIHTPNSGGPGRPRNIGLEHATGTFVFFLDADDYLGEEALERLVAMAERYGTDVVLGKVVGVNGRRAPSRAFRKTVGRAKPDDVYNTLSVFKLFRRALVERLGLRFEEGLSKGEDGPFTTRMYLEADGISVVADYDCYYFRLRAGSQSRTHTGRDLVGRMKQLDERIELVVGSTRPGPGRDRMIARHLNDAARAIGQPWLDLEAQRRRDVFDAAAALVRRWGTPGIQRRLRPWSAIRIYCLDHGLLAELEDVAAVPKAIAFGEPIIEGRRLYARYPHFRDPSGIPDRCFDITSRVGLQQSLVDVSVGDGSLHVSGRAYLTLVGGSTTIVLRRWPRGPELSFPAEAVASPRLRDSQLKQLSHPMAGFAASVDLAAAASGRPLERGTWELWLRVGTDRVSRTAPLHLRSGALSASGGELSITRSGSVRVRVGRPLAITGWLERAEAGLARVPRVLRLGRRRGRRAERT